MNNVIHDKQKVAFNNLLNVQLPKIMKEHCFEKDGTYKVDFELYPCDVNAPYEEDGTRFVIIKTRCTISNLESGEEEEVIIDLLKLPVYGELGFWVNNNYMQVLDSYDRASGWSFSYDSKKDTYMAKLSSVSDTYGDSSSSYKRTIRFVYTDGKYLNFTTGRKGEKDNKKDNLTEVSISTFFRGITGLTNEELLEKFGLENPYNVLAFGGSSSGTIESKKGIETVTRNDCINALAKAVIKYTVNQTLGTVSQRQNHINKMLFDKSYMNLGPSNISTLNTLQSFKKRGINKILAEDIHLFDETIKAGTILTESMLDKVDMSPVDEIIVIFNGKRFSLKKFSNFTFRALGYHLDEDVLGFKKGTEIDATTLNKINESEMTTLKVIDYNGNHSQLIRRTSADTLAIEDLYTAYSIFINNVNGFDTYDSQYELTDRVVVPFDFKVCQMVEENLNLVCNTVKDNLEFLKVYDSSKRRSYVEDHYTKKQIEEDEISDEDKEIEASIEEENHAIDNGEASSYERSLINAISDFAQKIDIDAFLRAIRTSDDPENQMSDLTNIMAFQERNFKITPNFGNSQMIKEDMIAVQDMQFGRLDPMDQPESSKIGVVHHRTVLSREDKNGYLTTPYYLVKGGEVSEELVYLTANEEVDKYVAEWNETFYDENGNKKKRVNARFNGTVVTVDTNAVTLKEYSQIQSMSPARLNIPFMNHAAGKRIQMACNHQKQAVPTFGSKRATIGTGGECILDYGNYKASTILKEFYDSRVLVHPEIKEYKDLILGDSISLIQIQSGNCMRTFRFALDKFSKVVKEKNLSIESVTEVSVPFMQNTPEKCIFSYRINANAKNRFSGDDIVIYNLEYDPREYNKEILADYGGFKVTESSFDTAMTLGQDLMVVFKTFGSTTIDDSITISSRLVSDQTLSSITVFQVEEELHQSKDKKEVFGTYASDSSYFNSNGLPKLGTNLKTGDAYVSKIVTTYLGGGNQRQKVRQSVLGPAQEGQVVAADIIEKNNKKVARILLATKSDIDVGDKMSGRCGNKGVVARIVPEYEMPYNPLTGDTADVCLNPQGVPSRMNISQLLEVTLGLAMHRKGEIAIISPFNSEGEDFVKEMAEKENVHPAMLIDGRTGHYFERPINYGIMHMLKMTHMVKKKIHSIGMNHPVDAVTLQPKHGAKREGGQAFGEMESWCLQSVGATKLLQEIQSTASDDWFNRKRLKELMVRDPYHVVRSSSLNKDVTVDACDTYNSNDMTFQVFSRSVGTEVTTECDESGNTFYQFSPLKDSTIRTLCVTPVKSPNALHSVSIFGPADSATQKATGRENWSWIDLGTEIILPTWFYKGSLPRLILCSLPDTGIRPMSKEIWQDIINRKTYISYAPGDRFVSCYPAAEVSSLPDAENYVTGFSGLVMLLKTYDLNGTLSLVNRKIEARKEKSANKAAGVFSDNADISEEEKNAFLLDSEGTDTILDLYSLKNYVESFIDSGVQLSDYIVTSYPVMPQVYRPEAVISSVRNNKSDFDWHYTQILNAVNNYRNSPTEDSKLQIFNAIKNMIGYKADKNGSLKHQNIISYFFGNKNSKRKDHGKMRETQQKKRLCRSGRSTIIPAQDPTMLPTQIGVPMIMCVKMFDLQLQSHMMNYCTDPKYSNGSSAVIKPIRLSDWGDILEALANHNDARFRRLYEKRFAAVFKMGVKEAKLAFYEWVRVFIEGTDGEPTGPNGTVINPQVVICGRQPSLHKFSIRAFYPKVVNTKSIQIHHLVCKGYNADFDGDQEWIYAPIFEDSKEEALRLLSVNAGVINPKNNGIILEHSQDIALGVYCATMLKNNKEFLSEEEKSDIHFYNSVRAMERDIDINMLHLYDLVCYTCPNGYKYLSTAGRILFNSLLPDGFTDKPFSNTLQLPVKAEHYKELAHDGLITSGSSNSKELQSFKLQTICEDIFDNYGVQPFGDGKYDSTIGVYQSILEFGFKYADLYGISISVEDLEQISVALDKDSIISKADEIKAMIEKDYQDGLVSEEDKKTAVANLYVGANKVIGDKLLHVMDRNNNIFIMFDSGARGSKNQIVQTCGSIGILQKTGAENLETSVTTNYYNGLSSFDLQQTSYSTRLSVASTQNETRNAGHATRQSVYMESGLEIVEKDCGKKDWWFDILWGQPIKDKCLFKPDIKYFMSNMNGRRVWDQQTAEQFGDSLTEDGCLTPSSFNHIDKGFKSVRLEKESFCFPITAETSSEEFTKVVGLKLISPVEFIEYALPGGFIPKSLLSVLKEKGITEITVADFEELDFDKLLNSSSIKITGPEKASKVLTNFLNEDGSPKQSLEHFIYKNFLKTVETTIGTFEFRYKMTEACRSLLTGRVARNLKYLEVYKDPEFVLPGEVIEIITDKTLDYIEDTGLERIEARILLDCETGRDESSHGKSTHGVCACCYGLKFSDRKLPRIGDNIGVEAAQAIGEPAAQLTMNLVHSGGAAGASISGGVQLFDSLLHGSKIDGGNHDAAIANVNGYVRIIQVDGLSNVAVIPYNKHCMMCNGCKVKDLCDFYGKVSVYKGKCLLPDKIQPKMIRYRDGEWINAGDAITEGYVLPQNINNVGESYSMKELIRKKQMTCLLNYFNTFKGNNIYINARHFEILARLQNGMVTVVESDNEKYVPGKLYEYSEILNAPGNIKYILKPISQSEVIEQNSGALSLLSFEDVVSHIASFTNKNLKSYRNSHIGRISVGEDLTTNCRKVLKTSKGDFVKEGTNKLQSFNAPDYIKVIMHDTETVQTIDTAENLLDNLMSLDLDSIEVDTVHTVSGDILNDSYEPLSDVMVSVLSEQGSLVASGVSDVNGRVEITGIPDGNYVVDINTQFFKEVQRPITLDASNVEYKLGVISLESSEAEESSLSQMTMFDNVSAFKNEMQKPTESQVNSYNKVEDEINTLEDTSNTDVIPTASPEAVNNLESDKRDDNLHVSGMSIF